MKRFLLLLAAIVLTGFATTIAASAKPAAAKPTLPAYFTLPAAVKVAPGGSGVTAEDYGEADMWVRTNGNDTKVTKQGKHWYAGLVYDHPPANADGKAIWALIKPSLTASGWTIPVEYDENPFSAMMRLQKDGKDVWAYMKLFAPDDIRLNIIEIGGSAATLVLTAPAATAEKINPAKGDFPYLAPLPGSPYKSGGHDDGQMLVAIPGGDPEQVVGTGSITKYYGFPPGLSTLSFVKTYEGAFKAAGWTVISQSIGSDATITAHYARNGRNIWAYLHMGGEEYSIKVSDAGTANDMAAKLAKNCHVALLGVLFDFNKSTLKPESDATLQSVLGLLKKDAALKVEVQGHTDNVGGDAYNQTLSEARAKSVMAWLTQHGIAAARLTFKGYGKTVPVATNDTDEGRAKNRRVEIANLGCKPAK
ncbi:MAG TPA: OmpA family protein [Rhizomicrobium sp.]|jgi:outer membrane protein OmpA-like peptidoglycan-associated protein|nr:OmpA family protein [Rhizomicrobium sp.]